MRQYIPAQVNVPANTPATAPVSQGWTLYPGYVHSFRIQIPRGHNGMTGLRLVYMGTPIIPFSLTSWLIGDGDTFTVPYEDQIMNTGLRIQAYNTDAWPHTFYLYADDDPHLPGQPPPGTIPRNTSLTAPANRAAIAAMRSPALVGGSS